MTFGGKVASIGLQSDMLDATDLASQKRKRTTAGGALDVSAGLFWDADGNAAEVQRSESETDSEGESSSAPERHVSKRAKRAAKKQEEAKIQAAEEAQLDAAAGAQSAEEFERMLMARPQSSYLWFVPLKCSSLRSCPPIIASSSTHSVSPRTTGSSTSRSICR